MGDLDGRVAVVTGASGNLGPVWSAALPKDRNNYYSSPLIAGGNLYAIREDGVVFVAKVKDKFELLATSSWSEVEDSSLLRSNLRMAASVASLPAPT